MRLLSKQHTSALLDVQTWFDNPFVRREARRDMKRNQPTKSIFWMALTLLLVGGVASWGLDALAHTRIGIPWFLGGDRLTALCIVTCGIHVWFIVGTSQKHTMLMLSQEAFRNTLMHLLMLPRSPFQVLL